MENRNQGPGVSCAIDEDILEGYRKKIPEVAEKIIESCYEQKCNSHIDYEPLPSRESVINVIEEFLKIVFPGYFTSEKIDPANLKYHMGWCVTRLFSMLAGQVISSIRHDCLRNNLTCQECNEKGYEISLNALKELSSLRDILAWDVQAAYDGDPAAGSYDEIIYSYPGIFAIAVYRLAHLLYEYNVPLLPRIMTEYAHSKTGIDIHPGAQIDERFVIDHGTGVVIGETATIGKNVRIYQGVTIGALSLPQEAGAQLRGKKRHPDIEDDVIIYSGAMILGGNTTIGARSVIGGNVWLTESVPPDTQVFLKKPQLVYKNGKEKHRFLIEDYSI